MMKKGMKKSLLTSCLLMSMFTTHAWASNGLVEMTDNELSAAQGQALLSLGYTAPDTSNSLKNYGFYKLGLEAKLELNANIRALQLGCGGRNGPGACDIDMDNVSLSGPPDGKLADGTPTWSKGRANTSAVLTNPFVEFAIKNPQSASTREISGFRLSAEEILGYLSAGTKNDINSGTGLSTGGGINTFSGFIKVGQTPVTAFTDPAIFGTKDDQSISADVCVRTLLCNNRTATSNINKMTPGRPGYEAPPDNANIYKYNGQSIWGINVPSQSVSFNFPETIVTGSRMKQLNLVVKDVPIPRIAIGRDSGGINLTLDQAVVGVSTATFFMGANNSQGTYAYCAANYSPGTCSYITDLKANVQVKQNFNLIHNLPITSGGYLALQNTALQWPGSDAADIAQPGWWLSFKDPLDFGALNPTTGIPMQDVLPQIATFITDYLSNNQITVNEFDAIGALFGAPLYKGLGDIRLAPDARAVMVLENLLLDSNQKPVSNCFGNLKFC
ncbi:hypothetical protein CS557_03795 [Acinetobacter junii]|uniref:hypothetical protein n=1 Tax=Acinetobacter junii TaxID=40215 RepID=UPI000C1B1C2B|nr:hypothetical protein [Acinetobacter junii]ATU44645.1 hypothetical protein CS557_03795 [Acinetobacter junii]UOB53081.1 hypothetical protein MRY16_03695 [Acinetobacter junii]